MVNPSKLYYTNEEGETVYNFDLTAEDCAII
jgi:hypothetical protein